MQTNLKSVLAVGAVVGLICVAAYPIVVVRLSAAVARAAAQAGGSGALLIVAQLLVIALQSPLTNASSWNVSHVEQICKKHTCAAGAAEGPFHPGSPRRRLCQGCAERYRRCQLAAAASWVCAGCCFIVGTAGMRCC